MRWMAALLSTALAVGCADQKSAIQAATGARRIAVASFFDLANCSPRSFRLTPPIHRAALAGYILAARPQILECLVDPENRGPNGHTQVLIKTSAGDRGTEEQIRGENLTSAGEACIRSALDRWTAASALSSPGETVVVETEFRHSVEVDSAVDRGLLDEASQAAAKIRLAEGAWCDCFAPWAHKAPRTLRCRVKLTPNAPPVATFDMATDVAAESVTTCLKQRVQALPLRSSDEMLLPYSFRFLHSGLDEVAPEAPPEQAFLQLEAVRNQRAADAALALGARSQAAEAYDRLVVSYQAKPEFTLVGPMKESCAGLLLADDGWIRALERELNAERSTAALISNLKAQEPKIQVADDRSIQEQLRATRSDLETARKTRASDGAACPRGDREGHP